MRILTFIFLLVISSQDGWAQRTIGSGRLDVSEVNNDLLYGTSDITGNPYLAEDFGKVTLFLSDNSSRQIEEAKFDICSHKLMIVYEGKEMNLNDFILNGFALEVNGELRYFDKLYPNKQLKYLERLTQGSYTLYKSLNKKFNHSKQSDQLQYGDTDYKKPYFSKGQTKYYAYHDNELIEFNPTKKGVLEIVPTKKQKSLANVIKSKKIKIGTDKGLIQLFKYLNK